MKIRKKKREPVPFQGRGAAEQREQPASPIRKARSPRNGIGSGIVTSRPASATDEQQTAQPLPAADRHGPAAGDLVGEVEADQRNQETMAVVLVGRPGVVEVTEVVPEQAHE